MTMRKISIDIPESVLLAEKTDEKAFARELSILGQLSFTNLDAFLPVGLQSLPECRMWNSC